MTIFVHVACDDEDYRAAIANYLDHQSDMEVVGASAGGRIGAAAARIAGPNVVVLGIPPDGDIARYAPKYRQMMWEGGAAVVAFCTTPEQAAAYHEVGIDRFIFSDEPARKLSAVVREAYNARSAGTRVLAAPLAANASDP